MSFVNISACRTADPSNVWVPKNAFRPGEPFAVVLDVQVDNSVVQAGLEFDATFQINNPRDDPYSASWFILLNNGDFIGLTSVVRTWKHVPFPWGTNFTIWWSGTNTWRQSVIFRDLKKRTAFFMRKGRSTYLTRCSSPYPHRSGTKLGRLSEHGRRLARLNRPRERIRHNKPVM